MTLHKPCELECQVFNPYTRSDAEVIAKYLGMKLSQFRMPKDAIDTIAVISSLYVNEYLKIKIKTGE